MPAIKPIKRSDLIFYLKKLGFHGPYSGGKHQFMVRETLSLFIPNPHKGDIGKELLIRILKQANINKDEWEQL
jgi:predicted RNA binding protein YcfA (HicA-like mRNA interferase family)